MDIRDLIARGESQTVEFKSTLQWDVRQKKRNPNLRLQVLKTIAAFLNTDGGILVIGVDDDGRVLGLDADLSLVGNSRDRFEQLLASLLSEYLGPEYGALVRGRFEELEGRWVYVIEVQPASKPVFLKGPRGKEFYIRVQTTTRSLDPEETVKYIENHWPETRNVRQMVASEQKPTPALLPPFHMVAIPHDDILEGRLTMDVFAADLWEVFQGRGPDEYRDPERFFQRT